MEILRTALRAATALVAGALVLAGCGRAPSVRGDAGPGAEPGSPGRSPGRGLGSEQSAAIAATDARFPVVVRDDLGRDVRVEHEPRRIVSLLPSHTETLFALGAGDRVVAVDDYSDFPSDVARLPKLGGLFDARVEAIVALAPDLVLASEGGPAAERLAAQGLRVWAGSARTLDDVFRVDEAIGRLIGRREEAAALSSRIRADLDAIEARLRGVPKVRVYYELDATPYTVGPGSFIGALLIKASGENIVPAALGEFPRISPELVLAQDPEVILGVSLEEAKRRPGWSSIRAVRAGRVDTLTPAERARVTRPGPRLAEGLEAIARRLHPEVMP